MIRFNYGFVGFDDQEVSEESYYYSLDDFLQKFITLVNEEETKIFVTFSEDGMN